MDQAFREGAVENLETENPHRDNSLDRMESITLRMKIMTNKSSFVSVLIALSFLVANAAAVCAQTESTPPPFPSHGKLVDIGGGRLHEPELVIKGILDVMNASMKSSSQEPSVINVAKLSERISIPTEDGGIIYADLYGSGDRAVVLAHGGQFNKESWEKQARLLVKAGFRVLAFDFRGYGQSKGPGQDNPGSPPFRFDVLAGVRYLRKTGAKTVSVVGARMGGGAAANASIEAAQGEIDRIVLLAGYGDGLPEKIKGRKLFIVARDDANSGGPRLPRIREQYEKAAEPKQLIILDGSAHAQFLFQTDQAERLMSEILRFLSAP